MPHPETFSIGEAGALKNANSNRIYFGKFDTRFDRLRAAVGCFCGNIVSALNLRRNGADKSLARNRTEITHDDWVSALKDQVAFPKNARERIVMAPDIRSAPETGSSTHVFKIGEVAWEFLSYAC